MNDRFRFRAWIIDNKKYETDLCLFGFGTDGCQEVEVCENDGDHFTMYEHDECVLEQCTGLKDKNGKIIYEGDIVTKKYLTPTGEITETNDAGFIYTIKYKNGCFGIKTETQFYPLNNYIDYHCEGYVANKGNIIVYDDCYLVVIGNIHENPELLED